MSKRTPGPLTAVKGSHFWTVESCDGQRLANTLDSELVYRDGVEADDSEGNARLFAAAPELLVAVEQLLAKAYKQNWNDHYPELLELAEAAVAKARGGS